jgi:pimeloyl-ACP methyl ester carboxylesterase
MGFFSVDFGGCGNSDGSMVTLGCREREDVEVVLDYLQTHQAVSFVCLYGRSMGAATALLVAADDRYYHNIAGLVLDSCYVSVREVALDIARKYAGQIPLVHTESVAGNAVDALREAVVENAGFDIDTIDVLRAAPLCQVNVDVACYCKYAPLDALINQ